MKKEFIEEIAAAVELVVKYDEAGRKKVLETVDEIARKREENASGESVYYKGEFTLDDLREAMKRRRPDESVQPKI